MKNINKLISSVLISSMLLTPIQALALTKEETIYANLNYDGKVEKTIVNNHLSNLEKGSVTDDSDLEKLLNINGKEKFTTDNQILTWESKGKDIYYQGLSTKELPITVDIKYYLNDKEISVKDLIGKKGKVTIKLNLKNNAYDKATGLYTPFVVTVGTTLNNKNNSNISITNGKVTSTGNKSMVVAIATPGLYESIGLEELKNLGNVELSFDTSKFSLNNIYVITTPKLLSESDLSIFNKMDNLSYSISSLQSNMDKVVTGANELKAGTAKLTSGAETINSKLDEVIAGVESLESGSTELVSGLEQILASLEAAKEELIAEQTSEEALKQAQELQELQNSNATMLTKLRSDFDNDETKIANAKVAAVECNLSTETDQTKLGLCLVKHGLSLKQISSLPYLILLENNSNAITVLTTKLQTSTKTIDEMISELTLAINEAKEGTIEINAGLTELKNGVVKLSAGTQELSKGLSEALTGTTTLATGLDQINKEGINKLSYYSTTANNYSNKLKTLVKLSKNYNGYSTSSATTSTFIYKVKSLTK